MEDEKQFTKLDLKDYNMKCYQQISDRVWVEYKKTFKKNPPRFSLIMRMVKKFGEETIVKKFGQLREQKLEPKDWNTYLIGIFSKYKRGE